MHLTYTVFDLITAAVFLFSGSTLAFYAVRWIRHSHRLAQIVVVGRQRVYPLLRTVCMVAVSCALSLPLLEVGLRYYFNHYGTQADQIRYIYSPDKIRALNSIYDGVPFLGFGLSAYYPGVNSLGYRGPEIVQPKPLGTYRIVALGGSTTYGASIDRNEDTYPAQLERILREEYGFLNVEVINAGVPNYTTWESLVNFEFRVLDLDPDLVIYYEATNDITARIVHPKYYTGLYPARGIWKTSNEYLGPSVLVRYVAINLGWMADPSSLESKLVNSDIDHCNMWTEVSCGNYDIDLLMKLNPPIYFERNLRSLIAIAQVNDVKVMLSSWTYFPDTTPITNIYTFPWRRQAVAEHNAILQQVAQETGVGFYDLFGNLPYNRQYWFDDGYHQRPLGCEEQARQYAQYIVKQGWLTHPT